MSEKQKPMSSAEEEQIIADWQLLFPSVPEAVKMQTIANQLIKSGLGMRKKETELQYMMRLQYCMSCDIPLCFINQTYMLEGSVHRMVQIKMWQFKKAYPEAEFLVVAGNDKVMIKQG